MDPGESREDGEHQASTDRRGRPVRISGPVALGLVLACLGGTLLIGASHKLPCATSDWSDGRQYRLGCYSDIVPLFGTEQLAGGRLPFLDPCREAETNCDEYPVLTMTFLRVGGWISGDDPGRFFWANAALLTICAAVIATCLYVLDSSRALWFALAPSLAVLAFVNWDLFAVMLAVAGGLAFFRGRDGWAGVLLGLGAAAKLFPALLVVPLAADRLRRRQPDRAILIAWTAAGTWAAVNAPIAILRPAGWWEFFRFNGSRPADWDSAWYLLCRHLSLCPPIVWINALSVATAAAAVIAIWWVKRRREPEFPRWQLVFPVLVAFLLAGKVYSPQFSLWLLPWLVLVIPSVQAFLLFELADVAVVLTRFSFFGDLTGVGGLPQGAFETTVMIRAAVLVWCVVSWVRAPARSLPIQADVGPAGAMTT